MTEEAYGDVSRETSSEPATPAVVAAVPPYSVSRETSGIDVYEALQADLANDDHGGSSVAMFHVKHPLTPRSLARPCRQCG